MGPRTDPALRTQQWVILLLEIGILGAFGVLAVRKLLSGDTGVGMVCVVALLYVSYRAVMVGRGLLGKR